MREELGPARIIPVASSLASDKEDLTKDEIEVKEINQVPPMTVTTTTTKPDLSPNANTHVAPQLDVLPTTTRPPALETLLQTSSSSFDDVSLPLTRAHSEKSTLEPPNTTRVEDGFSPKGSHETFPSFPPGTQLQEFWDRPSLTRATLCQPSSTKSRVIAEHEVLVREAASVPVADNPKKHGNKKLGSPQQSGAGAEDEKMDNLSRFNETAARQDMRAREGLDFNPSPTKTQLEILVPTATLTRKGDSPPTSPVPSPTYSSDFDSSSISQHTFD